MSLRTMPLQLIDVWEPTWVRPWDLREDTRPRPDEQTPHVLCIESIDRKDAMESELYVECPFDHVAARHWCTSIITVQPRQVLKVAGAIIEVGFQTVVDCFVVDDVCQVGPHEMLGITPNWRTSECPWPEHLPAEPGEYPVQWCSEGYGEDFHSWIEILG